MKAQLPPGPPRDKVLSLRDGRVLGYTQTGHPLGKPVFFFHGSPGSRLQRHPDETIAREMGIRLIGIDRPGYGLSDFQPDRTLLDWPADVAQLADALLLDPSVNLIRLDPVAAKKVLPASFPQADQAIFAWPDLQALDREDLGQAYRQGGRAFGWDLILLTRPWGFRLQDISLPIHLWHGEEDTTIPVAMERYLARILPVCSPHFLPGEGHTLVYSNWREILSVAES